MRVRVRVWVWVWVRVRVRGLMVNWKFSLFGAGTLFRAIRSKLVLCRVRVRVVFV